MQLQPLSKALKNTKNQYQQTTIPLQVILIYKMSKLPALTPRKVEKKLKNLGFILDHQTGSHRVYYNSETKRRAVVPFYLKDLKPGTLSSILREADISRDEFIKA